MDDTDLEIVIAHLRVPYPHNDPNIKAIGDVLHELRRRLTHLAQISWKTAQ